MMPGLRPRSGPVKPHTKSAHEGRFCNFRQFVGSARHGRSCYRHRGSQSRERAHNDVRSVGGPFHGQRLRACPAEPEMFDVSRPLAAQRFPVIRHVEHENSPVPQVMQGLGAFWVCAIAHHDLISSAQFVNPRSRARGKSRALLPWGTRTGKADTAFPAVRLNIVAQWFRCRSTGKSFSTKFRLPQGLASITRTSIASLCTHLHFRAQDSYEFFSAALVPCARMNVCSF